ncbi:MAG: phosphatidate cytidylyltransferase [Chthoniobacterales bacterium]
MTSKGRTFIRRFASTITLWVIILGSILSGNEIAFFCLLTALPLVGLWEYFNMLRGAGIPHHPLTGMLTAAIFLAGSFLYSRTVGPDDGFGFTLAVIVLFLLIVFARQMFIAIRDKEPLEATAYTLFGLIYIPWLYNFLIKLLFLFPRDDTGALTGQYYILYLLLVTKFTDMGAYCFGVIFGRHKFAPHISPAKTWEGILGALFTAIAGSYGLYLLIPDKLAVLSWFDLPILGLLLGVVAIVGDLAESIIKRSTNAKDSSHVLPGIGGTLDLIDSVLFTAPVFFFYLRFVCGVGL